MKKFIFILIAASLCIAASARSNSVGYKGNVTIGSQFGKLYSTMNNMTVKHDGAIIVPAIETVHGAQVGKYFFIGAGTGFKYALNTNAYYTDFKIGYVPLFGEMRVCMPLGFEASAYLLTDLGYSFNVCNNYNLNMSQFPGGFSAKAGVGFDIESFVLQLGYDYQGVDMKTQYVNACTHAFFIKIGVTF